MQSHKNLKRLRLTYKTAFTQADFVVQIHKKQIQNNNRSYNLHSLWH